MTRVRLAMRGVKIPRKAKAKCWRFRNPLSQPGVVRVNIQRDEVLEGGNGVGSGFVFDKKGHVITNAHVCLHHCKYICWLVCMWCVCITLHCIYQHVYQGLSVLHQ